MKNKSGFRGYLYTLIMVLSATVIAWQAKSHVEPANFTVLYLLIVMLSALWWGTGPSVFASFTGVFLLDFFLIPPYISLSVHDFRYLYTFVGFLIMSIIIGMLAAKTRKQAEEARRNEKNTQVLYKMSMQLAFAGTLDEVVRIVSANIGDITGARCAVFIKNDSGIIKYFSDTGFPENEDSEAVASWVLENGKEAGHGTQVLFSSSAAYMPLIDSGNTVAVMGLFFAGETEPAGDGIKMLNALLNQAASAIKKVVLYEQSKKSALEKESGKLQNALLNSISHDLRTPLVTITGALSSLLENYGNFADETRRELLETADEEAKRLNALVSNLLDMTRVESGRLMLKCRLTDIGDLIGASLAALSDKVQKREVNVSVPDNMPELSVDYTLMMRVFVNVADNALKYSPPEKPVDITVFEQEDNAVIAFRDYGFGIPLSDLEKVFDKFYRAVKPKNITGTGLGLAICRGIVEAHGGKISASNHPEGGAVIKVFLPLPEKVHYGGK